MNKIGWIIFSAVVVLILGGLIVWTRMANPPIDLAGVENNSVIAASEQNGNIGDHVTGKTDSNIRLVEFGDFQCPSCGGAAPNVNTLMDEYGDRVALVFRNFPLTTIHPNARAASATAEAAGLQGKYWEMHDLLYERQGDWSNQDATKRTETFNQYAEEVGLDIEKFKTDVASANVGKKISFDQALGKREGVSATPTFYLNGEKLDEETSSGIVQGDLTKIKAKLDELLK
jgi:protein-disulfide isomerase